MLNANKKCGLYPIAMMFASVLYADIAHSTIYQLIPSDNLKQVIDQANAGDVFNLTAGTYELPSGNSVLNGVRIFKDNLTIQCVGVKHTCVIKKNGDYDAVQIAPNVKKTVLKNFTINGHSVYQGSGLYVKGGEGLIEGLLIENNGGHGILLDANPETVQTNKVLKNVVRYNGICGIVLNNADYNWVNDNVIHDNSAEGICIDRHSDYNWVNNNRLDHNCLYWGVGAIGMDAATGNTVSCNTIINHHCGRAESLTSEQIGWGYLQATDGINFQNNEGASKYNYVLYNYIRTASGTESDQDIYLRYQDSPMTDPALNPDLLTGSFKTFSNHVYGNDASVKDDPDNTGNWVDPNYPNGRDIGDTSFCDQYGSAIHPER